MCCEHNKCVYQQQIKLQHDYFQKNKTDWHKGKKLVEMYKMQFEKRWIWSRLKCSLKRQEKLESDTNNKNI